MKVSGGENSYVSFQKLGCLVWKLCTGSFSSTFLIVVICTLIPSLQYICGTVKAGPILGLLMWIRSKHLLFSSPFNSCLFKKQEVTCISSWEISNYFESGELPFKRHTFLHVLNSLVLVVFVKQLWLSWLISSNIVIN